MTDFFGAFSLPVTVSTSTAGAKTTTSSFSRNVSFSSRFAAHTNALSLNAGTPGTFAFTVDTPGTLISGTNPAHALQADGTTTVAVVQEDLPPVSEFWETFDMGMLADAIALWTADGNSVLFTDIYFNPPGARLRVSFGAPPDFWGAGQAGGDSPVPKTVWRHCEIHYDSTTDTVTFYVDGEQVCTGSALGSTGGVPNFFELGVLSGPGVYGASIYFANVKFGTTREGSDVFQDNFSDGTLDAWTNTSGDVSVVAPPGSLVASLTPSTPGNLVLS